MDNPLYTNTQESVARRRRGLVAGTDNDSGSDAEMISQAIASFYFLERGHQKLFEEHAAHVVSVLRHLNREINPANIALHFAPELLEDLSYRLSSEEGMNLRRYLAELPEWVVRYLADADEFSQQTLRRRGFVATVSAR
jgi:hypothetical protein